MKIQEGIIIEAKIIDFDDKKNISKEEIQKELKNKCNEALKQIDEKEYVSMLKNAKIENILKIGIAFYGKSVEVKYERE